MELISKADEIIRYHLMTTSDSMLFDCRLEDYFEDIVFVIVSSKNGCGSVKKLAHHGSNGGSTSNQLESSRNRKTFLFFEK